MPPAGPAPERIMLVAYPSLPRDPLDWLSFDIIFHDRSYDQGLSQVNSMLDHLYGLATSAAVRCLKVSIVGGRSGANDSSGPATQQYGYNIGAGTDYIGMVGTTAVGNLTAGLVNLSTGSHNNIVPPIS